MMLPEVASRATPLQQFMLLVGATLVVGSLVLGGTLAWLLNRHLDAETVALTRREVEVHFNSIFPSGIFANSLTPAEAARYDTTVRTHFGIYDIVQFRLYDASGRMIYNYLPGLVPAPPGAAPGSASATDTTTASPPTSAPGSLDAGLGYMEVGQPPTSVPGSPPGGSGEALLGSSEHLHLVQQAAAGNFILTRVQLGPQENITRRAVPQVLQVFVPIRRSGEVVGVAEVYRDITRQFDETRRLQFLTAGIVGAGSLVSFVSLVGIFRDSTRRIRRQSRALEQALAQLQSSHVETLEALAAALEARDNETKGHSERVTRFSLSIGAAVGLDGPALATLQRGALLHDIGKIGVTDAILRKPGPLTAEEWVQMRRHVEFGTRMVSGINFLERALPVVRYHHERFDGSGYPAGLAGQDIPLAARIFAVADTLDAMTSDRPYRKAVPLGDARREIVSCAGSQFDPDVVDAFMSIPDQELDLIRTYLKVEARAVVGGAREWVTTSR